MERFSTIRRVSFKERKQNSEEILKGNETIATIYSTLSLSGDTLNE